MLKTQQQFDLSCGHCKAQFRGGYKQWYRAKSGTVYCSDICRFAGLSNKFKGRVVTPGKMARALVTYHCEQCKIEFTSKAPKLFCSINCYLKSPRFAANSKEGLVKANSTERLNANQMTSREKSAQAHKKGIDTPCLECGTLFYQKRASKSRPKVKIFCTTICYRAYFAKRFDRWIANPQELALPQCYDEFLSAELLHCLLPDCDWQGAHLSVHMNQAHGIPAAEIKRAAGFNLKSGLVSRPLAETLQQRPQTSQAMNQGDFWTFGQQALQNPDRVKYKSIEGREHQSKARAIAIEKTGPLRRCKECDIAFIQPCYFGKKLFCSIVCRSKYYRNKHKKSINNALRN